MRRSAFPIGTVLGGVLAAQAALAQSLPPSNASGGIVAQSRAPLGTTPAEIQADSKTFAMQMALGDLFEIESSNLALERSRNNDIKAFARMTAQDHAKSTEQLKDAYMKSAFPEPLPSHLDQSHAQKLARLRDLSGAEFDHAYMLAQLEAHQRAVSLLQEQSQKGDKPMLKQFAGTVLPTVHKHLSDAQRLATPMSAAR